MKSSQFLAAFAAVGMIFSMGSSVAKAGDAEALALYKEAQGLYAVRGDAATGLASNEQAVTKLDAALTQGPSNSLKYDILVLKARCIYFRGQYGVAGDEENNPAKVPVFEQGYQVAGQARDLIKNAADAYYVYALNLGRWGLAKGKLNSLFKKAELEDHIKKARLFKPKADGNFAEFDKGEKIDGYGPNRIWGRMYFALPGIVGGDNGKARELLKTCFENAKDYAINVVYYAEVLNEFGAAEKAEAVKHLRELVASGSPEAYNPSRLMESREEFQMAQKLLSKIGR